MKTLQQFVLAMSVALALGAHAQTNATFRMAGKILDAAGQPIAGATVEAYELGSGGYDANNSLEAQQPDTTAADGAFAVQVSRGSVVVARKAGLAPAWFQAWNLQQDLVDRQLTLTAPTNLAGVVMDETGKPVADAAVFVTAAFNEITLEGGARSFSYLTGKPARQLFATRTGADGHFRLEGLPDSAAADLGVQAAGKVLRPVTRQYQSPDTMLCRAGDQDIRLVLEPAASIAGKAVVAASGQPLAGVQLVLQPAQTSRSRAAGPLPIPSGADGAFRFDDVAADAYELRASFGTNTPADWVAAPVPVTVETGQAVRDVQVKAVRGGVLEVTVVGKADRKSLAAVAVNAYSPEFQSGAKTDSQGVARLRLLPGEFQITAHQENSNSENTPATVMADKTNRVEVTLAGAPRLRGVVHRPDGQPAAGLGVSLVGVFGLGKSAAPTDARGRFEIAWDPRRYGQNDRTFCVLVRDPNRGLAVAQEVDEESGELALKLAPGLTLLGRAECEGKPLTNATAALVFWTGNSGMHLYGLCRDSNTPGRFEIPALPPARKYGVYVSAPGYGQKYLDAGSADSEAGRLELEAVELRPADRQLAGQVVDAEDKPVAGVYVNLNGDGQPNGNVRTDRQGRFRFDQVCEGPAQLSANGQNSYGNIQAEAGDTNVVLRLGQTASYRPGAASHKLKGTVTDPAGQPVVGAELAVFPADSRRWAKTGTNGTFNLTWSLQPWQAQSGARLVVRDEPRDLAFADDLAEDTTNLTVQLKPALALAGRVEDTNGAPLAGAEVGLWFKSGNNYSQFNDQEIIANAQGRFEFKALPMDAQYIVFAKAKGRGRSQHEVVPDAETNRLTLAPLVLKLADRVLAGQVLNPNDKPLSGVNVSLSGDDQPEGNVTTDSKGRFSFKVCEGRVQLFASSQNGYAQATTEAGDTNLVIQLTPNGSGERIIARRASLKGQPLPDLTAFGLGADLLPAGKPVLLCLMDVEQRASRRTLRLLGEQHEALKQKGVALVALQAAVIQDAGFKEWKEANPVTYPVGRVAENSAKAKWATGVESMPWLILVNAQGRVVAEGFALDDLESNLKLLGK